MKVSFIPEKAHAEIVTITDEKKDILRRNSAPCDDESVVQKLIDIFKELKSALGLAAPQINISSRAFVAKLDNIGTYVFVNPEVTTRGYKKFISEEACFSIPDKVRILERHANIVIEAQKIYKVSDDWSFVLSDQTQFELENLNAAIILHEYDHINGVLISDYPVTWMEKTAAKKADRERRISIRREKRNSRKNHIQRISKKRKVLLDKEWKQHLKREKNRVEIQELFLASQKQFDS